jgi:hypothetical protein
MNTEQCCDKTRVVVYFIGIVGTFLIMAAMVRAVREYTRPAPLDVGRAEERVKARREVLQAGTDQLGSYGRIDAAKGSHRLPVERAMEIVIQEWKDPAAGRSNLIARWDKVNPPPPPPKPSEFE